MTRADRRAASIAKKGQAEQEVSVAQRDTRLQVQDAYLAVKTASLRDSGDVNFEAVIPSLRSRAGAGLSFKACTWFSTCRIHHRSASRFRDRRCFLLHSQPGRRWSSSSTPMRRCSIPTRASAFRFRWLQLRFRADGPVEDGFEKLDDTRFNLIVFGQSFSAGQAPAFGDLVCSHGT